MRYRQMKYSQITLGNKILLSDVHVSFIIIAINKFTIKNGKENEKFWRQNLVFYSWYAGNAGSRHDF